MYADGARVSTTVPALSAFLQLRSLIFDLAALELHVLTSKGHFKGVAELLDILFGNDSNAGLQGGFHEVGQSHLRIIEFVQSLAFDWSDTLTVDPVELHFLGQLNLHSCVRKGRYRMRNHRPHGLAIASHCGKAAASHPKQCRESRARGPIERRNYLYFGPLYSALTRHGILTNFVRGIKESDLRLQSDLKPDPGTLDPQCVFESH